MRLIDADVLIEDLEYDVELDARMLDDMDLVGGDRETVQFDKDCKQNAIDILRNAPTIEPQQWIPCSERLPEDYTDVLVWFEYYRYGDYNCMYQTYGIGSYSTEYDSWMINHETGWRKLRVMAWMPLPEPYKGES